MIPNWLLQRSTLTPDRIALLFQDEQWTFKEANEKALVLAKKLTASGVRQHTRIAIYASSNPQIIWMMYACMHLQCEMVLLNLRLTGKELAYQIDDAAVDFILVEDLLMEKLPITKVSILSFSEINASPEQAIIVATEWAENQTMTIMYTSGTTGFPKGVRQTVGNHVSSATSSVYNMGLVDTDCWLCTMPLFHISGFSMLAKSLLHGVKINLYPKFDVVKIVDELVAGTVTRMSVVAVTLERILTELEVRNAKASPKFLTMLTGGGPVPVDYLKRAAKLDLNVAQTYGMTETSSQTATLSGADALRKIGSVGKALFFNQIRIDEAKKPFEQGEILIRGPHVTPGYIGRFTDKPSQENGWLHSGDIGYLDDEGYLYVVDRRSDLIISGGENIYPAEIENILTSHEAVREVGVCGVEDKKWGQVPNAFVVLSEDVESNELLAFCRKHLAAYKVPHQIHIVGQLPRNGSNKLLRRKLCELLIKE
ncbi:o-succinylbenzoate--CoA ligase [Viridibacillus sp. YIM B01967]|uniref:2-succinylbenzoate--CoA ligase n=1 Tax=Viridibacillus soli TaxID=2798301 RepID=A0ABS1H9M6_9BACL|nr:o-succinylbenzoate--CoA ligase [Viridibacillus soli]MBK3496111.1 o-succinylbenzoate--CoA ligase [Viridibacillus soli]